MAPYQVPITDAMAYSFHFNAAVVTHEWRDVAIPLKEEDPLRNWTWSQGGRHRRRWSLVLAYHSVACALMMNWLTLGQDDWWSDETYNLVFLD